MTFVPWTPTFGATSGTLQVDMAFAYHKTVGCIEHIQAAFSVDDIGTASGGVTMTLPTPSKRGATFACVVHNTKQSCNATVVIGSSIVKIYLYDGTFPIAANHREIILAGAYEIDLPD